MSETGSLGWCGEKSRQQAEVAAETCATGVLAETVTVLADLCRHVKDDRRVLAGHVSRSESSAEDLRETRRELTAWIRSVESDLDLQVTPRLDRLGGRLEVLIEELKSRKRELEVYEQRIGSHSRTLHLLEEQVGALEDHVVALHAHFAKKKATKKRPKAKRKVKRASMDRPKTTKRKVKRKRKGG